MKLPVNNSQFLTDAYCEFTVDLDKATNTEIITVEMQIGEHSLFSDLLTTNIKCMHTSKTKPEMEAQMSKRGDSPLIVMFGEKEGPYSHVSQVIYQKNTNDCILAFMLDERRFGVVVYRNLSHKDFGLYALACHGLLDADIEGFRYIYGK